MALAQDSSAFQPYLYHDPSRPPRDPRMIDNDEWSTFHLWENGAPIPDHAAQCKRSAAAVEKTDLIQMGKRAPCVMFSKLKAQSTIPPHLGLMNIRLVCHLALIVPKGCVFRVAGEDRYWREGELLVFDDSIVHEAVNPTDHDRIVLIFEIWRPELSADERAAVRTVFDAIDTY